MDRFNIILILLIFFLAPISAQSNNSESEINSLVSSLDLCKNCIFIRNGSEHSLEEAKAHMLRKYEATKNRINTAEEFIQHIGSKSSISGKPYLIRTAKGEEIKSEVWLTTQLQKLRTGSQKPGSNSKPTGKN
ncbi:hypothetical protein CH373_10640 [Leptospira perolatii]|uniref:DUF5329 domain-containing protein n=2 Tax=Leptospira perolatii TaxID=2023191 RepID=A0A2M9ZM98_9LEPT|nr:hypothetical protein CH360_09595 [Leptospira perolatii]PJZ73157.1 hypothetical protein CH373_10640 [Leptospira perolatii]